MYGGVGVGSGVTESPTSPNHVHSKHHYNYSSNPQHFHHPNVLTTSSPIISQHSQHQHQHQHHQHHVGQQRDERDAMNFPPPPPPLSSAISNMQATPSHSFRSNPKLTGNAIPRPYPGSPKTSGSIGGGISGLTSMKLSTTTTLTNNIINNNSTNHNTNNVSNNISRSTVTPTPTISTATGTGTGTATATTTTSGMAVGNGPYNNTSPTHNHKIPITVDNFKQQKSTTTNNLQQINRNLEACVQDLHDKTFGQGGVVQITSNNAYNQQQQSSGSDQKNYEGYTSR